jgi:hypothetical protein
MVTSSETAYNGGQLLADLHKYVQPLQDAKIAAIVTYLELHGPHRTPRSQTDGDYHLKTLDIGEERNALHERLREEFARSREEGDTGAAAEHFDLDTQRDAFDFIKSDVRIEIKLQRPQPWIRLLGIQDRTFYHYQLYGAFWMLREERGARRGVFLADMMGLGKVSVPSNRTGAVCANTA